MNSEQGPTDAEPSSRMDLFVNEARLGVRIKDGMLTLEESPGDPTEKCSLQQYAHSAERAEDLTREIGLRFPGTKDRKPALAPAPHRQGGGILIEFARRLLSR